MKSKKKIILISLAVLFIVFVIWVIWGNTALIVTEITVTNESIPESFSGFKIAQISDLHNAEFGEGNEKLVNMLKDTEPDIIVITGDLIDSTKTDVGIALDFASQAVFIAPTYYVTGNHEANSREAYNELKEGLEKLGVTVLENESVLLERNGEHIKLAGLHDYFFEGDFEGNLKTLTEDSTYTILLAHRPEYFDLYAESGAELVFSGHAHGGQFRLPFIGGVVAPGQGFFPKYDSGTYTKDNTTMIVSRGLGNSIIPLRVNNRPEIVVAVLESK